MMKPNTLRILSVSVGAALIATTAAFADDPGRRGARGPGGVDGMLRMLQAADANGDRSVTVEEVEALQREMFAWLDRTGDGVLDIDDRSPLERFAAEQRQERRAEREAAGETLLEGEGRRGPRRRGLDANNDGALTESEFLNRELRVFDRLDANDDNVITPEELDAMAERREENLYWWRADEE